MIEEVTDEILSCIKNMSFRPAGEIFIHSKEVSFFGNCSCVALLPPAPIRVSPTDFSRFNRIKQISKVVFHYLFVISYLEKDFEVMIF